MGILKFAGTAEQAVMQMTRPLLLWSRRGSHWWTQPCELISCHPEMIAAARCAREQFSLELQSQQVN